jgi:hypothetical protein
MTGHYLSIITAPRAGEGPYTFLEPKAGTIVVSFHSKR